MKKLQNPTTFFFRQAEDTTNENKQQIQKFVAKLINKDTCQLCKEDYDTLIHIPRILIHCGHTFCTVCLNKFFINRRVRCPMCLKLVKYIDTIERLPINHSIYHHLAEKQNKANLEKGNTANLIEPDQFLFGQFQRVQKEAHKLQNPQKIDPESGLPFCVFHGDRVEHFYCESHRISGCRVCVQVGHSKPECKVLDLYNVDNPQKYLNPFEQGIQDPDVSEPFINMKGEKSNMLGLNEYGDDESINDDSDEDQDDDEDEKENGNEDQEIELDQSSSSDRKSI